MLATALSRINLNAMLLHTSDNTLTIVGLICNLEQLHDPIHRHGAG